MTRAGHICLALAALSLVTCREEHRPARPNVLLITIDTWREDRLSANGAARNLGRVTTPCIDALASEGLRFTHAETPRAKTTPALASLMTGLYPHEHGVRELLMPLDARHPVLAERLRDAGYATAAIVANWVLANERSGLARGFDSWTEDLPDTQRVAPEKVPERRARSLIVGAIVALGLETPRASDAGPQRAFIRPGAPWFLWLHAMDPHGIYDPPADQRVFQRETPEYVPPARASSAGEIHKLWIADYNAPPATRDATGRIDAALVRDLYDGEVHYIDAEIGRLIERLRASGLLHNTLVVITADHGESLGEQNYWFEHGRNVSEATCRIPLVVRFPDAAPRSPHIGVRDVDISLVDLAPTILDIFELPPLAREDARVARGTSLRAQWTALESAAFPPRAVFVEKIERDDLPGAVQSKGVRLGDWKLVRRYTHAPAQDQAKKLVVVSQELYDLRSDPREEHNLIAKPPESAPLMRLQAELLRFAEADVHFADLGRLLREKHAGADAETRRILEALGY